MNVVLGQYLTPLAYVADRPEDASRVAAELRSRMNEAPFAGKIASVRTIDDVLPQHQTEKLAELTSLRRSLTPAVRASLSADDRRYVDDATSDEALRPLTLADLPPSFLTGLRERDGTVGRVVLVYPNPGGEWWDASAIATFVGALRDVAVEATRGSGHAPPLLAGSIPLSSDVLGAIRHDGPLATGAALLGVVIVVLLMLRSAKMSAFVIGALVVGVTLMAGASHICGVRINFANFIAFPITFGIGVDYAVNVMSRYESEGSVDILGAVRSTGAAVALCSLTTIIGYSSLLMAENRALYLFGLIAVLGEVSCLAVALVSMPALVLVLDAPRRVRTSTADPVASGAGSPRDPHELSMH
jgi:type IV secretory pathway VirB2 component (pilin)